MKTIANAVALVVVGLVLISFLMLWIVEMLDKVSTLKEYAPWLVSFAEHKKWHAVVLLVCWIFLCFDGVELYFKEVPEVPKPPVLKFVPPAPPATTIVAPPIKAQCWVRNYSTPGNLSGGLTIMFCNAKYDSPFFLTIEYDQKLASTEAITFPIGGVLHYEMSLDDNKISAYIDVPSIKPNEPFSVVVHGSIQRPPVVTKVMLKTKTGVIPKFSY